MRAIVAEDLFESTQRHAYQSMSFELFPRFWEAIKELAKTDAVFSLNEDATLKEVLSDERAVLFFSEYCKLHLCEEQVLFWLEAKDHKLMFDPTDMLVQGQRLYDLYIDEKKSEMRINISDKAAKDIKAKLESGRVDRELFNAASLEVPPNAFALHAHACACPTTRSGRDGAISNGRLHAPPRHLR